jgi:hypothetical protein
VALGAGAVTEPAQAAAPKPPTPSGLPAGVEALASYVGAVSCDASAKPGSSALGSLLTSTYRGTSYHVARPCGSDSLSTTEHYDGRAVDWMVNGRNATQRDWANAALSWLLATDARGNRHAMARRLGVMYLIWNNRTWSAYRPEDGWREYNGCLSAARAGTAYDTTCHRNHVHISLSWAGAMKRSSYWSKRVAPAEFGPCRPWYLNWAPPRSSANLTRCASLPKVVPTAGASSLARTLVSYSGMYLRQGSTGPAVTALQRMLGVSATGTFGPATRSALLAWQRRAGVGATAVTDAATWRAIALPHAAEPAAIGFDADLRPDLLTRRADGTLVLHTSTWDTAGRAVGSGWGIVDTILSAGDFSGDTHRDVLARRPDGSLWLYRGSGRGGWAGSSRVGSGWQGFDLLVAPGDLTGNGTPDVLARRSDGTLWLYPGNGRGGWLPRRAISSGWGIFDALVAPGDFTGDRRGDLLARTPDGRLWVYAGTGRGTFRSRVQVGHGWEVFSHLLP